MPYSSDKQRRFFHSKGAAKKGIKPAQVEEYDEVSRGRDLPERAPKAKSSKSLRQRAQEKLKSKKKD